MSRLWMLTFSIAWARSTPHLQPLAQYLQRRPPLVAPARPAVHHPNHIGRAARRNVLGITGISVILATGHHNPAIHKQWRRPLAPLRALTGRRVWVVFGIINAS